MNTSWARDPALRERRKQDLLLASNLMRLHADAALREIGEPVDLWVGRVARLRQSLHELAARPTVAAGAGLLAFLIALLWRSRRKRGDQTSRPSRSAAWGRAWGLGWTAWRLWRRWQAARPPAA
jgi:hypothetical protein